MPSDSSPRPADPAVEAELERLPTAPIAHLRKRYVELFRSPPPKAFGPDLLRRSIAQRIQEKAYGGLPRSTQRLLDQMIKDFAARPDARIVVPRRIKPGAVLIRQWKGKSHRVTVLADGFIYDGETYPSLSEIAVRITGTRWNGPRFFGLRPRAQDIVGSAAAPSRAEGGQAARAADSRSKGGVPKAGIVLPRSSHLGGGSDYRKRNAAAAGKAVVGRRRS